VTTLPAVADSTSPLSAGDVNPMRWGAGLGDAESPAQGSTQKASSPSTQPINSTFISYFVNRHVALKISFEYWPLGRYASIPSSPRLAQ
jgi:hypothetical protein